MTRYTSEDNKMTSSLSCRDSQWKFKGSSVTFHFLMTIVDVVCHRNSRIRSDLGVQILACSLLGALVVLVVAAINLAYAQVSSAVSQAAFDSFNLEEHRV